MTLLTTISNEAVNDNLQKRWTNGEIYTYIGAVLISVNPFRGQQPPWTSRPSYGSPEHIDTWVVTYHTVTYWASP